MSNSGIAGMVRCACWLEDKLGIETLDIGRAALAPGDSCTLFATGRWLAYRITLDGGCVFVFAEPMDGGNEESLMTIGDTEDGWRTTCRLIAALERNQVRPIEAGTGRDGFVIG